jgi:hypothetical protein
MILIRFDGSIRFYYLMSLSIFVHTVALGWLLSSELKSSMLGCICHDNTKGFDQGVLPEYLYLQTR